MPESDYKIFLFKCSLCQIRWLKSHKLLPDQSSFAVYDMPTDYYYYWQAIVGDKQKTNMLVFPLGRREALVVVYYDTLLEIKPSAVACDAHWLFPSPPDTQRLLGQTIIRLTSFSLTPAQNTWSIRKSPTFQQVHQQVSHHKKKSI